MRTPDDRSDDDTEWWDSPAAPARRPVFRVVAAALIAATVAAVGIVVYRGADAETATSGSADANGSRVPGAVAPDPVVLRPLTLLPPTPVLDDVFSARMMRFAIALGEDARALADAEAALATEEIRAALGDRAFAALKDDLAAAKLAEKAPVNDDASVTALEIANAKLDNALLAARLPYFVDTSVVGNADGTKRIVLLNQYTIESTDLFASGEARVRSVRLRRIDRLNWTDTTLGFVKAHHAYAVVLVDRIDNELTNFVFPALADGAPMPLGASVEPDAGGSASIRAIADRAGSVVREELAALPGVDAASTQNLGAALGDRRALFARWDKRLEARGGHTRAPSAVLFDAGPYEADLRGIVAGEDFDSLRRIQARLAAPALSQLVSAVQDEMTASVERHEVQHRLDQIHAVAPPKRLDTMIPPGQGPGPERTREHITAELSAYVAQLARDSRMPRTIFTLLFRFLADESKRGLAEAYVAWITTEELATELGVRDALPLLHDGALDENRLAVAYAGIVSAPGPGLAAAAKRVWTRLFGVELGALSAAPVEAAKR
ncbi:MAG: hypothetical protein JWP87_5076 [Labilithrix sp.]|nr:hypothetical protein [Labilithrix sp.]